MRTQSDAHLFYDFKTAKSAFNNNERSVNEIPKRKVDPTNHVTKHPEPVSKIVKKPEPKKIEKKEISNLSSNPKYQSNMFIQNSRKANDVESTESTDPSLLSVAERRKLFEKKLRGENIEVPASTVPAPVSHTPKKRIETKSHEPAQQDDCDSDDYSTCESEGQSVIRF